MNSLSPHPFLHAFSNFCGEWKKEASPKQLKDSHPSIQVPHPGRRRYGRGGGKTSVVLQFAKSYKLIFKN
jgi:hypothetical protein